MFGLYKVTFFWKDNVRSLQPILVSERTQRAAVKRARAFVAWQYSEKVVLEGASKICTTPDDVLNWS